jgi:L-asparaginase
LPKRDKIALVNAGGQILIKRAPNGETAFIGGEGKDEEVLALLPDDVREKVFLINWSSQPLSHATLRMCSDLVQLAGAQVADGAAGVVVTAETSTLDELSYFADLVWSYPQPLVFAASMNYAGPATSVDLTRAVQAAVSRSCWGQGALLCFNDGVYTASDVAQISNCRRGGFRSLKAGPLAEFLEPNGELVQRRSARRGKVMDISIQPASRVEIIEACVGGGDLILGALIESKGAELNGLVLSAFGGGDVPPSWVPFLRKLLRDDVPIVASSRCTAGRIQEERDFEGSAKRLLEMGIMSGGALSPVQARARLAIGIGAKLSKQDLKDYMLGS